MRQTTVPRSPPTPPVLQTWCDDGHSPSTCHTTGSLLRQRKLPTCRRSGVACNNQYPVPALGGTEGTIASWWSPRGAGTTQPLRLGEGVSNASPSRGGLVLLSEAQLRVRFVEIECCVNRHKKRPCPPANAGGRRGPPRRTRATESHQIHLALLPRQGRPLPAHSLSTLGCKNYLTC